MKYLAGDIGGTKSRLAIFDNKRLILRRDYNSKDFKALHLVVDEFLREVRQKVSVACFGIPCPVKSGICRTPNLPWVINQQRLRKVLKCRIFLINDFEAVCHGIGRLKRRDFITLNKGRQTGIAAVLGAGTGLGEAFIYDGRVLSSEGGHADFAPRNNREVKLLQHLMRKFGRVSYERVLSGPGIANIYHFLTGRKADPSDIIASLKGKKRDAVRMFASIYGAQAGNLALTVKGAVFIAGGIAPKVLPEFRKDFMSAFSDKGRLSSVVRQAAVKIIRNVDVGLFGAASFASKQ